MGVKSLYFFLKNSKLFVKKKFNPARKNVYDTPFYDQNYTVLSEFIFCLDVNIV